MTDRIFKSTLFLLLSLVTISCNPQKILTEKDLLKEDSPIQLDKFGKFLWFKNRTGDVIINKKNYEIILKKTDSINSNYFNSLYSYNFFMTSHKKYIAKNISFEDKSRIIAYNIEYLYRCQKKLNKKNTYKNSNFIYRLLRLYNNDNNKYNREFKKHDYYGLELLKKHHLKHYKYFPDENDNEPNRHKSDSQN